MEEPLSAAPPFYAEEMIDRVLSELADYPGRLVLVIDDLHELASNTSQANLGSQGGRPQLHRT